MKFSLAAVSVSYEKHSSPSDDHSDTHYRCDLWNWELGHIGMIFGVCLGLLFLGSPSLGEDIKVPSWKMGMKEFSKCVKPGQFKSVSSVSQTMWVRRFDLAICWNFFSHLFSGTKVAFEWDPKGFHNVEKVNWFCPIWSQFCMNMLDLVLAQYVKEMTSFII